MAMLSPGDALDRYTIESVLGEGGMATVYLAYDPRLRRRIALKLVRVDGEVGDDARARMLREAFAVAELSHPNIVAVYDVGDSSYGPFIAMELVRGKTLRAYVGDESVTAARKIRWMIDVARALSAAHGHGIVHRDVKPGNVMVGNDGTVKVLDFGVARRMAAAPVSARPEPLPDKGAGRADVAPVTREGAVVGTPRYMAPEQLRGETVDGRTDQFAWGLVAYELVTGRHAWAAIDDPIAMWGEMMLHPPRAIGDALPPSLASTEAAILRALSPSPAERFPSIDDLLVALDAAAEARPSEGAMVSVAEPRSPPPAPVAQTTTIEDRRLRDEAATRGAFGGRRGLLLGLGALAVAGLAVALRRELRASPSPVAATATPPPAASASSSATPTSRLSHLLDSEGPHRVTFGTGCDELPSFSTDGSSIVFERAQGAGAAIEMLRLGEDGGGALSPIVPADALNLSPRLSPRGDRVTFLRVVTGSVGAYVAPVDGHEPPRVVAIGPTRPSWSYDGRGIWAGGLSALTEYDADSGAKLATVKLPPDATPTHTLALADGRLVAIFEPSAHSHVSGMALLSQDAEAVWLVHEELEEVLALSADGRTAISARTTPMGTEELVAVPLDGSKVESLSGSGIPVGKGLDVSHDGSRVTWSTCHPTPSIVEVTQTGFGRAVADDQNDSISLAAIPGGARIAMLSQRSGPQEPWIVDLDGKTPSHGISIAPVDPIEIAISNDGQRFAVATVDQGIYVGRTEGDPEVVRLTDHPGDTTPSFRFGDQEVVFTRLLPGGASQVMRVPVEGGEPSPLLELGSSAASCSPVDDRIVYLQTTESETRSLAIWDGRTGSRKKLGPSPRHFRSPKFSPDGRRVVAIVTNHEIIELDAATGRTLRDLSTGADTVYSPIYTPEGIFVLRVAWAGNVWLADAAGAVALLPK